MSPELVTMALDLHLCPSLTCADMSLTRHPNNWERNQAVSVLFFHVPLGHREAIFSHVDQSAQERCVTDNHNMGYIMVSDSCQSTCEGKQDFEERRNDVIHNCALAVKLCLKNLEGIFVLADIQVLAG